MVPFDDEQRLELIREVFLPGWADAVTWASSIAPSTVNART